MDKEFEDFPIETLPGVFGQMAKAVSNSCLCGDNLPSIVVLGVVNAAIGPGIIIENPITGEQTPNNLYQIGIADSGTGKSRVMKKLQKGLLKYETDCRNDWLERIKPENEAKKREINILIKALEKKIKPSAEVKKTSTDKPVSQTKDMAVLLRELAIVNANLRQPKIIVQDVTTQKLAMILQENHERIISMSADAREPIDNLLGKYNKNNPDGNIYLSTFSGEKYTCDRVTRDSVTLESPWLSFLWLIQEDKANEMFASKSLREGGFLPRCLISYTDAKPGLMQRGQKINPAIEQEYDDLVYSIMRQYYGMDKAYVVVLSQGAANLLKEFHDEKVMIHNSGQKDGWSFQTRHAEIAARVCATLHVMKFGISSHICEADEESMANAILIVKWYAKVHTKLTEQASYEKQDNGLKRVNMLLMSHPHGFDKRQACRARVAGSQRTEVTLRLLDALVAQGSLKTYTKDGKTLYRKPQAQEE